jgi:hypothetical protein
MQHFLRFPCSIAARLAREIEKMPRSNVPLRALAAWGAIAVVVLYLQ